MALGSDRVLIVGAGPTGLTLACALRQQGVSVRVIDKAPGPATTSRANLLHARGVEVLDRLDALGDLPQRSVTALRVRFYVNRRLLATLRFGDDGLRRARPALVVSQAQVEANLRRRLAELGGGVEWATPLATATQDADGVTAVVGDEETRTGWLAGCDGAHSDVRELAGVAFPGVPVAEDFLLADVHADWDTDRSATAGWLGRDGVMFAMPLPDDDAGGSDLWRLMADPPGSGGEELDQQAVVDLLSRLLVERAGQNDVRIRGAAWASVFRIHRRLADEYRKGRVLLAGDAVHVHSPFGGQGMLTGIGDAENLAWKLALIIAGRADEALLDSYRSERRPLAKDVLRGTTANTRLLLAENPLVRLLRDRVGVALLNRPSVQRRLTTAASQLWVSYRRGPLAARSARRPFKRPRPGDRVADLTCIRPDGTRTRLHAELRGRWALLVPDRDAGAACAEAAERRLGDHLAVLTCGEDRGSGEALLVRPDAHLAWRGRPSSASNLERWMDGALQRGRVGR